MLYCKNNNNKNRAITVFIVLSKKLSELLKYSYKNLFNKIRFKDKYNYNYKLVNYFNINIIILLIMVTTISNNNLYAEAKDSDRVNIDFSSGYYSCLSKCDSLRDSDVKLDFSFVGVDNVRVSPCCEGECEGYGSRRRCERALEEVTLCKPLVDLKASDYLQFIVEDGPFEVCNDDGCWSAPAVECRRLYKASCYVASPFRVDYSLTGVEKKYKFKEVYTLMLNLVCKKFLGDLKVACREKCKINNYALKIGGKEINTVRDLLDSVPATEFLKVYDPNMVNY